MDTIDGVRVRCPDDVVGGIQGCGYEFTACPDFEGFFDCPNCGMWFTKEEAIDASQNQAE